MKRLKILYAGIAVLGALIAFGAAGASSYREMKQGTAAYQKRQYSDAVAHFLEAHRVSPDDLQTRFNLASAQYQTARYDEAAKGFKAVAMQSHDPKLKQKAIYNLGNTFFRQGNLQAAVDLYRRALELNPSDLDARQNLEFLLAKGEKNKEEPQQGQNNTASESHQGRARNNNPAIVQPGQSIKPGALSSDEAERLLNSLNDDQRVFLREQAKRLASPVGAREKDW